MNWNVATFDDLVSFRKILFDNGFSALQPESTKTNVAKTEVTLDILSALVNIIMRLYIKYFPKKVTVNIELCKFKYVFINIRRPKVISPI